MAFTGVLGKAPPGSFTLGGVGTTTPTFDKSVSQTLTLTQLVAPSKTLNLGVSQTLTLVQVAVKSVPEAASSSLSLSQDVTFEKFKTAFATSTLALTGVVANECDHERAINQGLALTHSASVAKTKVLSVSTTMSLSQVSAGVDTRSTKNTLTLTDLAEYQVAKVATNVLSMGQVIDRALTLVRTINDNFIPSQQLKVALTIRRTVSQTVTFVQAAVGHAVRAINQTLSLSQAVVVSKAKPIYQNLTFLHAASMTRSSNQAGTHILPVVHSLGLLKSRALATGHAFGMNQYAKGVKVLTRSLSQSLSLTQELVQEYHLKDADNTLSLSQTVAVSKRAPRSVINQLHLNHAVVLSTTLKRGIMQTLVFKDAHDKYTGIQDREFVSIPTLQVVKIRQIVVLQSDTLTIVLPSPEFNDAQGGTGKINIKRTMSGGRRVYTRENVTSKLNYQFVIDRKKAIELRNFILNSNTKFLTMTNWKGEIWAVQMTNSPFSFGEDAAWIGSPGGNKSSITLEFVGVQTN